MPPLNLAVTRITPAKRMSGQAVDGTCRKDFSRFIARSNRAMVAPATAIIIHKAGPPGRKNREMEVFQLNISKGWCHRKRIGMLRTTSTIPTMPIERKLSGVAS